MEINLWIPVIGTLCGAMVGFATSFITSWWNVKQNISKAIKDRNRSNYEEIYNTLIAFQDHAHGLLQHLYNQVNIHSDSEYEEYKEPPSRNRMELLVKLYAKELVEPFNNFNKKYIECAPVMAEVVVATFKNLSKTEKVELSDKIIIKLGEFLKEIENFQRIIENEIEP